MAANQEFTLDIANKKFDFVVRHSEYSKLIDGNAGGSVTQTNFNFCSNAVVPNQRDQLLKLIDDNPGLEMVIANKLSELYSPPDLAKLVKQASKTPEKS